MFAVARSSKCRPGAVVFYSKEREQNRYAQADAPTIFEDSSEATETAKRMAQGDRHGRSWFVLAFESVSGRGEPVPPPVTTVSRPSVTLVRDHLGRFARARNAEQF
jgi:hypothetical protein